MKRVLFFIGFLLITLTAFNQSIWTGFFKPVRHDLFGDKYKLTAVTLTQSQWLMRPYVNVNCVSVTLDKDHTVGSLNKTGIGLSYSNFTNDNGNVINTFSVNAMILFDVSPTKDIALNITPALGVSALKIISCGLGYDTGSKKFLGLLGISYNFTGL